MLETFIVQCGVFEDFPDKSLMAANQIYFEIEKCGEFILFYWFVLCEQAIYLS